MTSRKKINSRAARRGLTLVEICLALGIAVTLAAVAVPAVGTWVEEYRFRNELTGLAETVMRARRDAEATGQLRMVSVANGWEPSEDEAATWFVYPLDSAFRFERLGPKDKWLPVPEGVVRVEAGGILNPQTFRLVREDHWISFRFDPLTGHLMEEGFSL